MRTILRHRFNFSHGLFILALLLTAWARGENPKKTIGDLTASITFNTDEGKIYDAYVDRGWLYHDRGEEGNADEDFQSAIKLDPKKARAHAAVGIVKLLRSKADGDEWYRAGMKDFDVAISLEPRRATTFLSRGETFRDLGYDERAMADFDKAVELKTAGPAAYEDRGYLRMAKGQWKLAREDLEKLRNTELDRPAVMAMRGLCDTKLGDQNAALAEASRALKLDPKCRTAYRARGLAYLAQHKTRDAVAELERARAMKPDSFADDSTVYFDLGFAYNADGQPAMGALYAGRGEMACGRYAEALKTFDKAIKFKPDLAEAHLQRGLALSSLSHGERKGSTAQKKLVDQALASITQAIKLDPKSAGAYRERGRLYAIIDGFGKPSARASADLDRAVSLDPKSVDTYVLRALLADLCSQYDQAIADYSAAIKLDPDNERAYYGRALDYVALKKHAQAIPDFDQALERNPQAETYVSRAWACIAVAKYDDALVDGNHAVAIDPQNPATYHVRGYAKRLLLKPDESLADFKKAASLDPKNELYADSVKLAPLTAESKQSNGGDGEGLSDGAKLALAAGAAVGVYFISKAFSHDDDAPAAGGSGSDTGAKKPREKRDCGYCGGTGKVSCPSCGGTGRQGTTDLQSDPTTFTGNCYSCGGSARVDCTICGGTGKVY